MSHKCRLRSYKSIGEDGKWAADRIEQLEAENKKLSLYKQLAGEYGLSVFADLAELQKQRDRLLDALEHFATWARGQHRAQSKGCHATFDMMMLRDEIDFAEAAIASVKETK